MPAARLGPRQDIPTAGIVVVEGFSTGATIRELIGLPVAVAFSANNLFAVARQFRQAYPDAPIYIAGDNDHWKARELDARGRPKPNVGRIAAEKAASSVAGITILPEFKPEDRGTDWNDVFVSNGPGAFLEQWRTAVLVGKEQLMRRVAKGITSAPGGQQSSAMREQRDISTNQSESRSARGRS
jgi:putative DNA primase/helicase